MKDKKEVWQDTLSFMVLKTLDAMGAQHGCGIARRIEQISEDRLAVNGGADERGVQTQRSVYVGEVRGW